MRDGLLAQGAACQSEATRGGFEGAEVSSDLAGDGTDGDNSEDLALVDSIDDGAAGADIVDSGPTEDILEDSYGSELELEEESYDHDFGLDPVSDRTDAGPLHPMRVVVAGDSWSAGMAFPDGGIVLQAIQARGIEHVTIDYATTAIPGSEAEEWAENDDNKLDLLASALDSAPVAEVLFMTLGGNDFLSKAHNNLGRISESRQNTFLDRVGNDLQTVVDFAVDGRPHLTVVIVGYDYLNYFAVEAATGDLPSLSSFEFNALLVGLEERKLEIARDTEGCEYAHNLGILQYRLGDDLFAYGPEVVPFPGSAPDYQPFPGGNPLLPSPLAALPLDGVHPTAEGHRLIIDNTLDQGLENLLLRRSWY